MTLLQVVTDSGPLSLPAARELAAAVAVLSAMITPAVLISACGSLAISTSNRLSRTIDRTRKLSEEFGELVKVESPGDMHEEERRVLFDQLERATRRSRMLQRAMTRIYLAISVFVATSVAIGVVAVISAAYAWIPISLGLLGAALLFHASVLLIAESRIQLVAIRSEMDFVWRLGQHHAPSELVELQRRKPSRPGPFRRR